MKTFYWKCCNKEHESKSLDSAMYDLEIHEKEKHKSKMVGSFGMKLEYVPIMATSSKR